VNDREMKGRVAQAPNLAALHPADHDWDVFAQLRTVKELQTKAGKPFLVLELGDLSGSIEGKVWSNSAEAMAAAKAAAPGPV
jgi:DNA polymerase III alpha subunit